jgi:diguanylate cyclase (GGDEF)-like protein/putative nucleotidyltransferase with HDIG domain
MPPVADQTPRILFVDGGSRLGTLVRRAIDGTGCELRAHSTPSGLGHAIATYAPDLLLVDVHADGWEGGFALCGELRSSDATRETPVILVASGEPDERLVERGLLCGADDCVCVGGRVLELRARVRVQLRRTRERDRLQRLRAERDVLRREATLDALTRLPNRRALDAYLEEAWGRGAPFAVAFVDIDHFKSINDGFGHEVGDRVLRATAAALAGTLRSGDRCGRWGGEEFMLIVPAARTEEAAAIVERHRRAIEGLRRPTADPAVLASLAELGDRVVTASFGVAVLDPSAPDASVESLCQRADAALYEAKRGGRNRVVVAPPVAARGRLSSPNAATARPPADVRTTLERALEKELATGRAGLPLLPAAAQQAMRLAEDPRTNMVSIAKLVDRDPPLAARFVAVAGSAIYSRGVKPTTTHAALVRIGLATARDLLLQVVYERTSQDLPAFSSEVGRSFERSVRAAIAASQLTAELRVRFDSAYLCGLLHDIGEARIYRILAQQALALENPEVVAELVAKHHERAGAEVARAWRLPPEIVEACAHHHDVAPASLPVRVVMGADAILHILDNADEPQEPARAVLQAIGVAPGRIDDLVERARETLSA